MGLYCKMTKQKPYTLSRCKAKEKPRQRGRGGDYLFFSSRSARAAQSSCVSSSVKSYSVRSWSASALLHPPSYRAAALLETSFNMAFPSFPGFCPFSQYIISQALKTGLARNIFALGQWGGVALRCSPAKVSGRYHLDALNSAEKNQKTNRIQDNITCRTPSYYAEPLVNGLFAALSIDIRVRGL